MPHHCPAPSGVPTIENRSRQRCHVQSVVRERSATVTDDAINITPTTALPAQCPPDRISQDAALLAALSQVTSWRRNGDVIDFLGATNLRFRLMTN